jgi:hypothetical protein
MGAEKDMAGILRLRTGRLKGEPILTPLPEDGRLGRRETEDAEDAEDATS